MMKIRNILLLTFLGIIISFGLVGIVEHRHISRVADTFQNLERQNAPSLTALLELSTSTRRASIKALEYSLRGKPKDREKAGEALAQMSEQLRTLLELNPFADAAIPADLATKVDKFMYVIRNYLRIAEGPVIDEVLREQKHLHAARSRLITHLDQLLADSEEQSGFDLLLIKSEARKVSVKVIEFILHGNPRDRDKSLQAMQVMQQALQRHQAAPGNVAESLTIEVTKYLQAARSFLSLLSTKKYAMDDIYGMEQEAHRVRKELLSTLYPLTEQLYQQLDQTTSATSRQLWEAEQVQIVTLILLTIVASGIGVWLARTISRPLSQLSNLVERYGRGEKLSPDEVAAHGTEELAQLGRAVAGMINDRNALEESLRERESFLRMLFDTSPVGLVLMHMDGTMVDVNRAFADILGHSVEETLALTYWDVMPAEHADTEREELLELEHRGTYGPYEKECLHKDGRRIPVRLLGRVIERDGKSYIWSIVEDISASKQVTLLNRRLVGILEHSFDEIYIFDDELKFVQVSTGALENLGYTMDEMQSMGPVDLKPDFDDEKFNAFIEPLRKGEQPQLVLETEHQRKDGSNYPVQVRLQASRVDSKLIFSAIIIDVTEQKKAAAEIEKYQKHLEGLVEQRTRALKQQAQIIDQTHDSVVTTDLDGMVTSWNGGAEQLFGYSSPEAIGRNIAFVYPEGKHEFLADEIIAPLKAHGRLETEVQMQRADSSVFPAHLSLSMLYDENGEPAGMVGYSLDISERKQREQELARMTSRFQESNRELESFAYSVSHDLRAPLRAIDGFSLALLEDYGHRLDDTAQDYLQRVRSGAQRMGMLIDDMLQLSRVNRQELKEQSVDLGELARDSLRELQASDPVRELQLELGEDMQVRGDPRLLRSMLDNLLGNAWKFTAREAVSRISVRRVPGHNDTFVVRDNGVGFDMRYADKLFGAFQRLHRDVDFPGTGVGLATVQRIVHRHGGSVWADAKEGEGASFYFSLVAQDPLSQAEIKN